MVGMVGMAEDAADDEGDDDAGSCCK